MTFVTLRSAVFLLFDCAMRCLGSANSHLLHHTKLIFRSHGQTNRKTVVKKDARSTAKSYPKDERGGLRSKLYISATFTLIGSTQYVILDLARSSVSTTYACYTLSAPTQVGAEANCGKWICCRNFNDTQSDTDKNITAPAGPFGNFRCDTPTPLAHSMLDAIRELVPNAQFTISTGDIVDRKS